ncbi:MAG: uroporphyrinogen-III C-methyltransferase [Vicinamibacterales bacterium]
MQGPETRVRWTRKAVVTLRRADLVLYDALVDERVVAIARRAQRFFVGKRAGRHALAARDSTAARQPGARGRRVVRLKGGDPFVFGRGGEEAQALERAGIPHDVVPGVTSAIAAPASAGIPVTHREYAGAFVVASGHDVELFTSTVHALKPGGITLVILMGLGRRTELAETLLNAGWSEDTPAAIVCEGTLPTQQVWRGSLDALRTASVAVDTGGPAVIVVGAVAALNLSGAIAGVRPVEAVSPVDEPIAPPAARMRARQGTRNA